jgi:glycosyltransferase involved in cell wall biosynthesis
MTHSFSTKNLKIALVADWLSSVGGSEKVVWHLHQLFPTAPIFTTLYDSDGAKDFKEVDVRPSFLQKLPGAAKRHQLYIPLMPFAISRIDLSDYDLVISSSHTVGHGIKIGPKTVHICYCHTPVRWAWVPEIDSLKSRLPLGPIADLLAAYFRWWTKKKAHSVTHFVANSSYIAARVKQYFKREATVIYPPIDTEKIPLQTKKSNYYLMSGRLINYKKPELVIDAFNKLKLPLKVVGNGPLKTKLIEQAESNIEFLGYLSDQELYHTYARARALIFPPLEDFGMVPVEAMAAGTPVIGYGQGGLLESVIENKTGSFFRQQTSQAIIAAVRDFEKKKFDPVAIRHQAQKFDTKVFQSRIIEMVEKTLASSSKA